LSAAASFGLPKDFPIGLEYLKNGGTISPWSGGVRMVSLLQGWWRDDSGQDIAEYAVMLAVILVIVIGTVALVGGNANNVFSSVANSVGTPS
jgi:Flp pilus assembly pilin Flp